MDKAIHAMVAMALGGGCGEVERPPGDAPPSGCIAPAASPARIPEDTAKPGWAIAEGVTGTNDSGTAPSTFVVGDSLLVGVDVMVMSNAIRFFHGTSTVTVAAPGASLAHFNKDSLIRPSGLHSIDQYEKLFGTVRITVLALGSNDARIITSEAGQATGYTVEEFAHQVGVAVDTALAHSQCVILVNVANHWNMVTLEIANQVNDVIRCAATGNPRVRAVDWNSASVARPEWFASPTDIHHSEAGKTAYRDFITNAVGAAITAGC